MAPTSDRVIALLTDFGLRDWYVASMKGIIVSRAPSARLVDITHEIPPQDVVAGALTLAAAAPWFPRGSVFVVVVDPGVGSDRALLAVRADGRYFLGPDNGVLTMSLAQATQVKAVRLTNRRYWLPQVTRTFHGRDILAPVAAFLARGGLLERLGPPAARLTRLALPQLRRTGRGVEGHILHIDGFGNLITNIPQDLLGGREAGAHPVLRYQGRTVRVVSSYADGRAHELIALVGSLGLVELAIREGSAAWTVNAKRGDAVELRR